MRKRLGNLVLVGALGLSGAAVVAPGIASGADAAPGKRLSTLQQALSGLVSDGTLTQAQADKVAGTLAEQLPRRLGRGPGERGPHGGRLDREALASALGMTVAEVREGLQAGRTLAQLAEEKGVSREQLVDRLVAAGEAQLTEDVAAGTLTQEQADRRRAQLRERVTDRVDRVNRRGPEGQERRSKAERQQDAESGDAPG